MFDPTWWPSKPADDDNPRSLKRQLGKKFRLHQMFDPDNQDNVTVHVGVKDDVLMSWVVSHKSIPLHDDDSRVIFDNTEDFV